MIWDGECHFCKRWIERWREITAGKVDYATYQEAGARFPEIPVEQFKRAVAFIEHDGEVFFAAEAVYRSLRCRSSRKWLAWSYDHVPGFAGISEAAYKFIARHRGFGSFLFLWGKDAAADFLPALVLTRLAWSISSHSFRLMQVMGLLATTEFRQ
jgi:predicted DCC family thiol-disulfide oxidoreductase YuxK